MSNFKRLKNQIKEVYTISKISTTAPCMTVHTDDCSKYCHNCEDEISDYNKTCMQYGHYKIKNLIEEILPVVKQLQEENIQLKRNRRLLTGGKNECK